MEIQLREINAENWDEAVNLQLRPGQEPFVASNLRSLAEAYVKPDCPTYRPFAIYHEGQMVGFAMYCGDPESARNHYIQRLMIDGKFQGRGFGRAAMIELLRMIRKYENCEEITLTAHVDNESAQNLYRSLGFSDTGEFHFGQKVFTLYLKPAPEYAR